MRKAAKPVMLTRDPWRHHGGKTWLPDKLKSKLLIGVEDCGISGRAIHPITVSHLARSRLLYLSDGRCNGSSAEAGVIVAITGHGLTPRVGGTHYHRQRASLCHYCTHQRSEIPLTYPAASHLRTCGAPQVDELLCYVTFQYS
ncbi:hypothetical protein AVEN_47581-1 [Araneus ventricosus]|uniref:Uncharacterized protein n=1 Tax=Araneus ventricosus TaxID=182803 RepID=A0A4Y2DK36_ARAVE|nr:hypothetical protein AVEN_47581-1 [Araneus ventricosus]